MPKHFISAMALLFAFTSLSKAAESTPRELLEDAKRIVFLGDSITASGQYAAAFDAWLTAQKLKNSPQVINMGLASETVSGLSEKGHAGGRFPRPDLHERLARVLSTAKPDLIIACYGMNCGIYQPFDEERFKKYQDGWTRLKEEAEKSGAKVIAVTPPFYDDLRSPRAFSYNEVLDKYSAWLVGQRENGWVVIDLHTPMTAEILKRRETEPKFTLQPDGVHPNAAGHWLIAQQLIASFGGEEAAKADSPEAMVKGLGLPPDYLKLVQQRSNLLRDAYVFAAGHKRPGVARGLPIDEANAKAKELTGKIEEKLGKK